MMLFLLFRSGCRTIWLSSLVLIMFQLVEVCGGTSHPGRRANETAPCSAVRSAWISRGFGSHSVPTTPIAGDHLNVCHPERTCCTEAMEEKLHSIGKQEFLKMSNIALASIRHNFIAKSTKYRAFCIELVENSTRDLHDMFQKTYGLLYLQNVQIFADLFRSLQNFFRGKDLDLNEVLERFFTVLFQRMFALLNTSYDFNKKYLDCVAEYIDDLKPFGDVPQKLSVHVRRAFTAAATFIQGLRVGRNALHRISRMDPTDSCSQGITRMLYCSYCKSLTSIKPCLSYCSSVMSGCFHYSTGLNEAWKGFINAMLKVADRLDGPFNIESVIEPLDVKISDAIMNFQENSEAVTSKVFQECGQPTLGSRRRKRQTVGDSQSGDGQRSARPSSASVTALDQMMIEIREMLISSKEFWSQLTSITCSSISASLNHEDNCWDGKNKVRYGLRIVEDKTENNTKSRETNADLKKSIATVEQEILQLKSMTSKLHNAYAGQEVNWMDMDNDDDDEYEDDFSGDDIIPPSTPLPPPHHRHHHVLKNNNNNPITVSTIQPWDVQQTKLIANAERSRVQAKKSSRNASWRSRPLAALQTLALILAFCVYSSHL